MARASPPWASIASAILSWATFCRTWQPCSFVSFATVSTVGQIGTAGRPGATCQLRTRVEPDSRVSARADLEIDGEVLALGLIEADLGLLELTARVLEFAVAARDRPISLTP